MNKYITLILIFCIVTFQSSVLAVTQDNISVTFNQQKLKSKLKRQYKGYEVIITNNDKSDIDISNIKIPNGVNGETAYLTVEESPGGAVGYLWIINGPLGIITFGISWVVAAIMTPIVLIGTKKSNQNAKIESELYKNEITIKELKPEENTSIYTLIPKKISPSAKLM